MSGMEGAMGFIGPVLSVGGTVMSAVNQRRQGTYIRRTAEAAADAERVTANFEAKQQEFLGAQAKASAQREAFEQRRAAALLASKALANAAASGAGASDPDVLDILSEIQAEGTYRSAVALYEGDLEAYNRDLAAKARRMGGSSAAAAMIAEGRGAERTAKRQSINTVLGGASSFMSNYGDIFFK